MIYRMWTKGDEKPKTLPKDCEFLPYEQLGWVKETEHPEGWGILARRWPAEHQEQRKKSKRR